MNNNNIISIMTPVELHILTLKLALDVNTAEFKHFLEDTISVSEKMMYDIHAYDSYEILSMLSRFNIDTYTGPFVIEITDLFMSVVKYFMTCIVTYGMAGYIKFVEEYDENRMIIRLIRNKAKDE